MYLIAGLGNIGDEYKNTRHNVGFDVIDILSKRYNISFNRIKFKGEFGEGFINNEKCILLKPRTYMNLSGEAVAEAVSFYKIPNNNIIVIHDDISLECGKLRVRTKGSAGGHNGIKSIISCISSEEFIRIKVGVGSPKKTDLVSHVLGRFSGEDAEIMPKMFEAASDCIEFIIKNGSESAMNKFNGFKLESI